MCLRFLQRQAAFSLWELLIALAILSFMLLSISAWQLRGLMVARQAAREAKQHAVEYEAVDGPDRLIRGSR
jgi:prepilin-type N-terminal cleavage/methylation domain-containing protein